MKIAHLTEAGTPERANEDRLLLAEPVFAIFDGATSLDGYKNADGMTGGALASTVAYDTFSKAGDSLLEKAAQANANLRQAMIRANVDATNKKSIWCTTIAAVEIKQNSFDWIQISDSLILIIYSNNTYKLLTPDYEHDLPTLHLYKKLITQGVTDLFCAAQPQMIANRYNMNKTYGVLSGEPEALTRLNHGTESLANVSSILLFSDGAIFPKKDPDDSDDWHAYIELYNHGGIQLLHKTIREIEHNDPHCWTYPRLKPHDDFSIIALTF
ncbi:MAG: protein phosphatase 2C domain-containing protein [Candidatus Kerfeldbacteria bacterium]|nr:protein phosphatase 2C domain-containing protein [Candidatus Kerfeldbacteria bacterium]